MFNASRVSWLNGPSPDVASGGFRLPAFRRLSPRLSAGAAIAHHRCNEGRGLAGSSRATQVQSENAELSTRMRGARQSVRRFPPSLSRLRPARPPRVTFRTAGLLRRSLPLRPLPGRLLRRRTAGAGWNSNDHGWGYAGLGVVAAALVTAASMAVMTAAPPVASRPATHAVWPVLRASRDAKRGQASTSGWCCNGWRARPSQAFAGERIGHRAAAGSYNHCGIFSHLRPSTTMLLWTCGQCGGKSMDERARPADDLGTRVGLRALKIKDHVKARLEAARALGSKQTLPDAPRDTPGKRPV